MPNLAETSSSRFLPDSSWSGNASPIAVSTASVCSRNELITLRPRPPQPSSPSRTAEFAWLPNAIRGFRIVIPAAKAVLPMNSRRPILASVGLLIASLLVVARAF